MKTMKLCLSITMLLVLTLFISSCSKEAPKRSTSTNIKVMGGFALDDPTILDGGILIAGENHMTGEFFIDHVPGLGFPLTRQLPNGMWMFAAMGWSSGSGPFTGVARCSNPVSISLDGLDTDVVFTLGTDNCKSYDYVGLPSFHGLKAGDATENFYPLKVVTCDSITSFTPVAGDRCDGSAGNPNVGDMLSFRLMTPKIFGTITEAELEAKVDEVDGMPDFMAPAIESACINMSAGTSDLLTSFRVPMGTIDGIFPVMLQAFDTADCLGMDIGMYDISFENYAPDGTPESYFVQNGEEVAVYLGDRDWENAGAMGLDCSQYSDWTTFDASSVLGDDGSDTMSFRICNATQLVDLATQVNADAFPALTNRSFALMANIDISSYANWNPIGNATYPFKGKFEGNNFTINGLTISSGSDVGLFGQILGDGVIDSFNDGAIYNLYLTAVNLNVAGGSNVGGIAGSINSTAIFNSSVSGTISGDSAVGGIVGFVDGSSNVENCDMSGSVTGNISNIGGIVGSTGSSGCFLRFNSSSATIAGNASCSNLGGLVGYAEAGTTIEDSYASGTVTGVTGGTIGGLVAENMGGAILRSHATGNVSSSANNVGGLVGNMSSGTITGSYATGTINGVDNVGGLIGNMTGGTVNASFTTNASVIGTGSTTGSYVGGFAGSVSGGTINDSYSKAASVTNANGTSVAGGFTADLVSGAFINRSYSVNTMVSGGGNSYGFGAGSGVYTDVFWDDDVNTGIASAGNNSTTAAMQVIDGIYAPWGADYDDVGSHSGETWIHTGGAYPILFDVPGPQ